MHAAGRKNSSEKPTVRVGGSISIPDILREFGVDPLRVLLDAGIDPGVFNDPDYRLGLAARGRLLKSCVVSTGCSHFGLLVGQRGGLHSLGVVGLFAKNAPDVETALRSIVQFLHLHVSGTAAALDADGDLVALRYDIFEASAEAAEQTYDGAVALMFNIMRTLCGPGWVPVSVEFTHRRPADTAPWRRFFRAPLVFDADRNAVVFSARWLNNPLAEADPELRRLLQKQIDSLQARYSDDFVSQVRGVLATALLHGRGGAEQVAGLLSMHSRTLSRRLRASGTSFQSLADECRFEISRQLLGLSNMSVARIAAALDYADASAFTRAFRRWSGTTPGQFRALQNQGAQTDRSTGAVMSDDKFLE